jgi:BMFP domain-containing protein YqiC
MESKIEVLKLAAQVVSSIPNLSAAIVESKVKQVYDAMLNSLGAE